MYIFNMFPISNFLDINALIIQQKHAALNFVMVRGNRRKGCVRNVVNKLQHFLFSADLTFMQF